MLWPLIVYLSLTVYLPPKPAANNLLITNFLRNTLASHRLFIFDPRNLLPLFYVPEHNLKRQHKRRKEAAEI
jgi:hypothetical protein